MNENISQQLRKIGLQEKEVKTLEFLLSIGEAAPGVVAKAVNINRTTAYDILNALVAKGFATKLEKKAKLVYQVISPKYWSGFFKRKEGKLQEQKEIFSSLLPVLEDIYANSKFRPHVVFYEGLEGIQQALLDSMDCISPEIVGYSAVSQVVKYIPSKVIIHYTNEKIKREIKSRFVVKHTEENTKLLEEYKSNYYRKDSSGKFVPKYRVAKGGKHQIENEIMIYDNKLVIINIIPPHFSATLIQDKHISETQKAIFEIAWQVAEDI